MSLNDAAPVAGIAIMLYVLAEILKATVLKNRSDLKAIIPYFCAIIGAVVAVAIYVIDPTLIETDNVLGAVVAGAASGLIATGANQFYKQFVNLLAIASSTKTEVETAVSNMSADEKKEYIADQISDVASQVLDKIKDDNNSDSSNQNT